MKIKIWYIYWLVFIIIFCIVIPRRNKMYLDIIRKKKRGERKMPQEMIKEFIGKVCAITLFNESFGITGKIVTVEGNWLKVEEKNGVRMVNGDMIRDIKIMPEKYQK